MTDFGGAAFDAPAVSGGMSSGGGASSSSSSRSRARAPPAFAEPAERGAGDESLLARVVSPFAACAQSVANVPLVQRSASAVAPYVGALI